MTRYLFILAALILLVSCDDGATLLKSRVSSCGGFDTGTAVLLATEQCNETLTWNYDETAKTLVFLHEKTYFNCAYGEATDGHITISATEEEHGYLITEKGYTDNGAVAMCMCVFDLEATIENVDPGTINLTIQNKQPYNDMHTVWSGAIDLSQKTGVVLIKERTECI